MIAVDTNLLVYAHRLDSPWNEPAYARIRELSESRSAWAIPWPCVHEFFATVTHHRIFPADPTSPERALFQIGEWVASPSVVMLAEGPGYFEILRRFVLAGGVVRGGVHDARIAALCVYHGVSELWTADRDFGRFPALKTRNPLVEG